MALQNKNNMLPTYQGNYSDMIGAINAGEINSPCWMFLEDRNDLAFIHWERDTEGVKKLVAHTLLWEKVSTIEDQLSGLVDPDTGETISVVDYVQPTINIVEDIKKNGATVIITSDEEVQNG